MPNHSEPSPREYTETPEYTAQYDELIERHSLAVIGPILTGLIEGIAKNPRAMDRTTGRIWMTRSKSLGLTIPTFTIFFSIEGEGPESEQILLLWIEENSTTEEITGQWQ
jgi:hypothetical protein